VMRAEVVMANKQNFTPEEWTKVLESTMLAGMAVSAAEPSGLWGLVKEGFASSSALAAAKSDAGSSELIKGVVAEYETSEGRSSVQDAMRKRFAGAKPGDAVQRSLDSLREVSTILDAKAPNDAPAFKAWLRSISQKVAEASSEGGFLGIGGVQVSDKEKATLAEISKALGTSVAEQGAPLPSVASDHTSAEIDDDRREDRHIAERRGFKPGDHARLVQDQEHDPEREYDEGNPRRHV